MNLNEGLLGKPKSFWIDTTPSTNFPALKEGISVDVAIVGAGIMGVTSAVFLKMQDYL